MLRCWIKLTSSLRMGGRPMVHSTRLTPAIGLVPVRLLRQNHRHLPPSISRNSAPNEWCGCIRRRGFSSNSTKHSKDGASDPTTPPELSSTSGSSQPRPPESDQKPASNLTLSVAKSLINRLVGLLRNGGRRAYDYARQHPRYILFLLGTIGLGYGFQQLLSRGQDSTTTKSPFDPPPVSSFRSPQWTDSNTKKEFAQLIHLLPRWMWMLQEGLMEQPIDSELIQSCPNLPPKLTPLEALERLRILLDAPQILDLITTDIPPDDLIEPLIELVCNPVIHPHAAKYAAVCLNRMCNESDGRLCKIIAEHSTYDLLVALSHYTDFHSWNYIYLLQQHPELVAYAEKHFHHPSNTSSSNSTPDLPAFLRPFHFSSSAPSPMASSIHTTAVDDTILSMNHNGSPVSNFLSHFLAPESSRRGHVASHPHHLHRSAELSPEAKEFISLILSLPPVHSHVKGETPVDVLQHALNTGAAERERGSGLVDTAKQMGKDVVQHSQAIAAAYRSALASDDLALLKTASSPWLQRPAIEANDWPSQIGQAAGSLKRNVNNALHSFFSRRPSYKLGQRAQHERQSAKKQEVAYHAFRAFATLSQDAHTAAMIIEAGGIERLYQVYQQYPHELRVQIQVARALANLLEHAHVQSDPVTHQPIEEAFYTTYHVVARSGFLPMLVHWSQHALNYTDAAPDVPAKRPKKSKPKEPNLAAKDDIKPIPVALSPSTDSTIMTPQVDSAQPLTPSPAQPPSTAVATIEPISEAAADAPEPHPLRQPHHPESSASLRNKLQLQSARALINMRSILSYKYLSEYEDDKSRWLNTHDSVSFPILSDEVYQFYPLLDTLQPPSNDTIKQSSAQKHSQSVKNKKKLSVPSLAPLLQSQPPLPPPEQEYDIVFLHGLMGNPLRTWRLHSMHDRTIGWIPSTPEEKRRAGLLKANGVEIKETVDPTQLQLTPLERHLSNIVASGPLPVVDDKAAPSNELIPASELDSPYILPLATRATEAARQPSFDPSPAAPAPAPVAPIVSPSSSSLLAPLLDATSPNAPIHASQHSLDFETLWPRDWLPTAIPNSRILSLGYYTALSMKTTGEVHSKSLDERANELVAKMDLAGIGKDGRKVIWVTHSMGGLIVKKILLHIAHEQESAIIHGRNPAAVPYAHMLDNTIATVFYSTPHSGTWLPQLLNQEGFFSYLYLPSHEIMDLQNQTKLRGMNEDFMHEVIERRGVSSLAMGEGIGTPILHLNRTTQKMVNWKFVVPSSSHPGYGSYLYFPTQNHLTICKPKTELDENYKALITFIQDAINKEKTSNEHPI